MIEQTTSEYAILTSLVSRVLKIEEITWGAEKGPYLVRYRGRLYGDTAEAYDQLAELLQGRDITHLFRQEEGYHTVILVPGAIRPKASNPWINLLMLILTALSVLWVGINYSYDSNAPTLVQGLLRGIGGGLAFALSLMLILLAHEFGHYLAARYHRTAATLPFFIPMPFPPFGTMGAFIQLKEPPKNKRVLLDIGIAGPLSGLLVAIPVLIIGLYLSNLDRLPLVLNRGEGLTLEGNSLLYLGLKYLVFGRLLPEPWSYGNLSPLAYWIRYFFTGQPLPIGGMDVLLHPMALAGWAGLLVTALNLIPAGQLDGGHLLYVLLGRHAQRALPIILIALMVLGMVWQGWWLWALLIFFLGRYYAEPLDQITVLDPRRRAIAYLGLVIFILVFTPIPLTTLLG